MIRGTNLSIIVKNSVALGSGYRKLLNVAHIIAGAYDQGNSVVVVVSAQGDTTMSCCKSGRSKPNPSKREMDVLLSTGEQVSMSLLAMTISLAIPLCP